MTARPTKLQCEPDGAGYLCVCQCGLKLRSSVPHVFHACGSTPQPPATEPGPGLVQQAMNFAASAAKHIAAGAPRCTQEQIDARFAICQQCEHFDGKACRKCGCPVVRERQFISKLSWAGEKCPVGKWGPVEPPAG